MSDGQQDEVKQEGLTGFFDADGKWTTVAKLADHFGLSADEIREQLDALDDIDIVRVNRNEEGEPVTAQLTPFAADLYKLPEDADVSEVAEVYIDHGKEPPEAVPEEIVNRIREADPNA